VTFHALTMLPDGNVLPWPRETYDRLQAIR